MVKTYAYGFPRIGKNREYKKVIESFWKNKIDESDLISELQYLEEEMENTYSKNVDSYPSNEMTMYDKMLDTAIMLGFYDPQRLRLVLDCNPRGGISSRLTIDNDWEALGGEEKYKEWREDTW